MVARGSPGSPSSPLEVSYTPGQPRPSVPLAGAIPGITAIIAYLLCDLDPRFVTFYDD